MKKIESSIINFSSENVLKFLQQQCDLFSEKTNILLSKKKQNLINNIDFNTYVHLFRINDLKYINKYFEKINESLPENGKFISCVEPFDRRKIKSKMKNIPVFKYIYYLMEFLFMRFFPKVRLLKKIYFFITRGKNRYISQAEFLGRLICCGFRIIDIKMDKNLLYASVIKVSKPKYDMNPSYGPIFKMKRIGKNYKFIYIYKLRTMYPYSEYLQSYIFKNHGTSDGDKIKNDYRVNEVGSFFRKIWVDELPMFINLIKGDVKLVGVRPLSEAKFKLYPEAAQKIRVIVKPGIIPPFYADLPKNFDELITSEINYTKSYLKNPLKTDIVYFFKAFFNIFFRGARSK